MGGLATSLLVWLLFATTAHGGEIVRVGAYQNPPKVFITQDGRTIGVFPEVLEQIAGERGWEIEYVHGTWQECLDRLAGGDIDLMLDMAVSEERQFLYSFSEEPVLVNWGTMFCRTDISIGSFLDMEGRTVAVMRESIHTTGPRGIKALLAQFGVSCHYIEVEDYQQVLMLLDSKQADIGVVNRLFGTLHGDEYGVSPTPIIFNPQVLKFSTRKDAKRGERLLKHIDESLRRAKQNPDSAYHRALAYYLGGGTGELPGKARQLSRPFNFSPAELRWISDHPRIRISVDPGFAPFEFLSEDGEYRGMAADFLNLLAHKTKLEFELVRHRTWSASIDAVRDHETDLLPCVGDGAERHSYLSYSEPYLKFARVIVTPLASSVLGLGDLAGLRVGVQVDSSHHAFLKEHTTIEPRLYETFEDSLLAVSRGEIDATVGNLAVTTHLIQNLALTNLKLAGYADPKPQSLAFGVRKDWPELTSILNKALDSVSMRQRNAILAKWLPLPRAARTSIDLSQEEREWLLMHPRIRVAWDREWAPIEFADADGTPKGISMEYLKALEDILGVRFDTSLAADWQSTYNKLKERELDMSSCLSITPERLEHLAFTETYLSSPVVLFAHGDMPYISEMSELRNLRVAVVGDYATDEWISRDYPQLPLTRTATIEEAFSLLGRGKVDVFIGSVLPGNYYLSKQRHHDIKIVGETPYAYKLRMAVRKDWPLFAGILRKALAALPEVDRTAFYRKWVWIRYEHGFDYSLFGKIVVVALAVILVFVYWNRRLSSEIVSRKRSQAALAESEKALRAYYADLKELGEAKENLTNMIVHDMRSPLTSVIASLDVLTIYCRERDQDDDRAKFLNIARTGARTVTDMAQSLLDIGRLESGRMPLKPVCIDMNAVAVAAIRAMEAQAHLAEVRLVLSGNTVEGKADPDIIQRVFFNLIGNAINASPRETVVEVRIIAENSRITVEVRDSGRGIPKAAQQTVFDKFTTVESGGRQKTSVGLGLAFCKLAIEAHGGHIAVESEVGKGSTFRFDIPQTGPGAPG